MATISTHLRTFKEPNKEQALRLFFSLPPNPSPAEVGDSNYEKFEINSVLTLEGQEDSYVRLNLALASSLVLMRLIHSHSPGHFLHHYRPGSSTFYHLISASARSTAAPCGSRSTSRASAVSNGSIRAQRVPLHSLSFSGMGPSLLYNSLRFVLLRTCSVPTYGKR